MLWLLVIFYGDNRASNTSIEGEMIPQINKIYLDMDGVLADFDKYFKSLYGMTGQKYEIKYGQTQFWERVYETPDFFRSMPRTPWFEELMEIVENIMPEKAQGAPITILSSPSRTNQPLCMLQKRQWIDVHMGEWFPAIFENKKYKYAGKGRLLIDDQRSKCLAWEKAGGIAHHFTGISGLRDFCNDVLSNRDDTWPTDNAVSVEVDINES